MWPRITKSARLGLGLLLVVFLVLTHSVKPDLRRATDVSLEVEDFSGKTLNVSVSHDGTWRLQTSEKDVSPAYLAMLLRIEDQRFYLHPGIDPLAMIRALGQLAIHGRVVSGGSTLTMQVARLLHPHRHDLAGKLRDIGTALLLEAQLTKPQILDLYLTLAPFGGNIEGVRAASLIYFGHGPDSISPQEAALLVALPQSPARRRPDRHPMAAQAASRRVLARVGANPPGQLAVFRHRLPQLAPHLTERLREAGASGRVRTTIDAALQTAMQALARRETGWFGTGVEMAALVVRNSDRAVLGYLGGSDFFARAGMIDMTRAIRSPGSALKPFIYGMAIDDGLIRPDTRIKDARLRIADYAPQDFDRAFHGTVTAEEALQQSYNPPAVTLLDWLGAGRVAATLRGAGAHIRIPGGGPATLPLALGGVGMNLWDITGLYTGLANGGTVRPLRFLPTDPDGDPSALMTRQAATAIVNILADAPLPAGLSSLSPRRIAYKTGTSFGFRDGWAFGATPGTTIGVWVGRADGTPRPGAFARGTAAPLLFQLFGLLPDDPGWPMSAHAQSGTPRAPALRQLPPRDGRLFGTNAPRIVFPPAGFGDGASRWPGHRPGSCRRRAALSLGRQRHPPLSAAPRQPAGVAPRRCRLRPPDLDRRRRSFDAGKSAPPIKNARPCKTTLPPPRPARMLHTPDERILSILAGICAVVAIVFVLQDAFEVMLLPRRVQRRIRFTLLYFRVTWSVWARMASRLAPSRSRESLLSHFGALSMLGLFGFWAGSLILSFGVLDWALQPPQTPANHISSLPEQVYMSGVTFFTLGYGDVVPHSAAARFVSVVEAGTGLGFIAVVIGYLPLIHQLFSRREAHVIQLDGRAGSPPTAVAMLTRHAEAGGLAKLDDLLREWEVWGAELLESHLSYPMLAYYRSQHDNQSWLAAIAALTDCCALILVGVKGMAPFQARMTFGMMRQVVVEMAGSFKIAPSRFDGGDRLPPEAALRLDDALARAGLEWEADADALATLQALRATYEPLLDGLARHLLLTLPGWLPEHDAEDHWGRGHRGLLARRLIEQLADRTPPNDTPSDMNDQSLWRQVRGRLK